MLNGLRSINPGPSYIYGLTDEFGQVRYVGRTNNLKLRFKSHKNLGRGFLVVGMAVLERVPPGVSPDESEKKWIAFFGRDNLFNRTDGGSVWPAQPLVQDVRQRKSMKIREQRRALNADPVFRHKLVGSVNTPEVTAVRLLNSKKQFIDPAQRELRRQAMKAYWAQPDVRALRRQPNQDHKSQALKDSWARRRARQEAVHVA